MDARPPAPPGRDPAYSRRQVVSGDDLLADSSVSVRKLRLAFLDSKRPLPHQPGADPETTPPHDDEGDFPRGPAYHLERYMWAWEVGSPEPGQPDVLARAGHNHDFQYVDKRETQVSQAGDGALSDVLANVAVAPNPQIGADDNRPESWRSVTWEYDGGTETSFQVWGQFSNDAGVTFTEPRMVGVTKPGARGFVYFNGTYDFADTTNVIDRYIVLPLNHKRGGEFKIPRAGYDGKLDDAWMPDSVLRTSTAPTRVARVRVNTNTILMATQTFGGVTVAIGDTVLLTGQGAAAENGPWIVQNTFWTRPTWMLTGSSDLYTGVTYLITEGTYAQKAYMLTTTGAIVVDTTAQTWTEVFAGGGASVPTGDGFRHITSGAEDAAAKLVESADVHTNLKDPVAATPGLRTLGNGAAQACAGNDSRLSDSRTPTAHKTSHADGGSDDVVKPGRLRGVYVYATSGASGTHTPASGTTLCLITLVGAGGGGGGADGNTSMAGCGGGGAAGGVTRFLWAVSGTISYAIGAYGAGGTAGNNAGTGGGDSTATGTGLALTAKGGPGGASMAASTTPASAAGGATVGGTTGGDVNVAVGAGCYGRRFSGSIVWGGDGADGPWGRGGKAPGLNAAGGAGTGYGSGGSGACAQNTTTDYAGGDGTGGLMIVEEYF